RHIRKEVSYARYRSRCRSRLGTHPQGSLKVLVKTMVVALGVTGCIAAYKAVEVLRGLQKRGASVKVVMTRHATEFVGLLTFQSISGFPVISEMFAPTDDPEIKHIQLAQSIDLLLVAPATANALAKFANGIADDFLSTLYISTTAPV